MQWQTVSDEVTKGWLHYEYMWYMQLIFPYSYTFYWCFTYEYVRYMQQVTGCFTYV